VQNVEMGGRRVMSPLKMSNGPFFFFFIHIYLNNLFYFEFIIIDLFIMILTV